MGLSESSSSEKKKKVDHHSTLNHMKFKIFLVLSPLSDTPISKRARFFSYPVVINWEPKEPQKLSLSVSKGQAERMCLKPPDWSICVSHPVFLPVSSTIAPHPNATQRQR